MSETEPSKAAESSREEQRARTLVLLLSGAAELAYILIVTWVQLLPEHRKQEIRMRAARTVQQLLSRFARRAGEAGMREELQTGRQNYGLPLVLSLARDRAGKWYEGVRP